MKRARAASLGNAFAEIESLLVCPLGQEVPTTDEEEITPEKIEESKEMLKTIRSRPWPMSRKLKM